MVLTLYGAPQSTCTQRVALVLTEKEVPFKLVPINFAKGEHKAPGFIAKQPFGQVPYIDDDGFILYESRAIARYIAAKYPNQGTSLVPTDFKANALFEQAVSVEQANFDPPVYGLVSEKIFKTFRGLQPDEARVKEYIEKLNLKLAGYEAILSSQKYVAGDELTLADLFHLPYGTLAKKVSPESFESKPHVNKWLEGLAARPAWIAVKDGVKGTTD